MEVGDKSDKVNQTLLDTRHHPDPQISIIWIVFTDFVKNIQSFKQNHNFRLSFVYLHLIDFLLFCPYLESVKRRYRKAADRLDRDKAKHPQLAPCSCRRNCNSLHEPREREAICQEFWSLDFSDRRYWIVKNIEKWYRNSTQCGRLSRQKYTLKYRIDGKEVCKKYFLHTIEYKDDAFSYGCSIFELFKEIVERISTARSNYQHIPILLGEERKAKQ